ncbi:unnamed protein product [Didymodactylos carnosus]|uniref:Integrase catalytic domain-containing protein n=1 Tax=Didymodactylos carnosus TaxID=1234261 RepID=A0A815I6M5_9BILA|nr:unnamed protein product [Didymodactylos carnosus]CAF4245233.1 unnamed protein product [Didymodactylos carnosus]
MLPEIASQYSWIPKFVIEIFLKHYFACQVRKPVKQHVVSKPIISLDVMTRLQIDLVDMRTRLDVVSNDVVYQWILNCINHFSKFSWAYPLQNKSATEVAKCLRGLCYVFGPPRLLHSDNGREFVADVVQELKALFPGMCFVRGRPRHPQSQGCIERTNGVLTGALVVYGTNTRVASATKCTPHEVMFGQKPRCDQEFWKIIQENDIVDEEQLLTPVGGFSDDIVLEGGLVDPDGTTNSTIFIDTETAPDDANIPSLLDVSSTSICTAPILNPLSVVSQRPLPSSPVMTLDKPTVIASSDETGLGSNCCANILDELDALLSSAAPVIAAFQSPSLVDTQTFTGSSSVSSIVDIPSSSNTLSSSVQSPRHALIRRQATDNYLATANKKRKLYDEHLQNLAETLNVGDCVGINIHDVDRTNTDPKLLPCLIFSKEKKEMTLLFN